MKKTIVLGDYEITVDVKEAQKPCSCTTRRAPQPRYAAPQPCREPDGFDAHIDRPRREMYGGWDAEWGYQKDLAAYRKAEAAVKACTWPCREPMKGAPTTAQPCGWPTPQRAPQRTVAQWSEPCACTRQTKEVRSKAGRVPCGAVVVGHTWNGEPVFDR